METVRGHALVTPRSGGRGASAKIGQIRTRWGERVVDFEYPDFQRKTRPKWLDSFQNVNRKVKIQDFLWELVKATCI